MTDPDAALRERIEREMVAAGVDAVDDDALQLAVSVALRLVGEERKRGQKDTEALCEVVRSAMVMKITDLQNSIDCARADAQMHSRDADAWSVKACERQRALNEMTSALKDEQAISEKLREDDRYAARICKEIENEGKKWKQRAEIGRAHV